MRIRSNFHDYYDAAMAFGQDPLLVYDRFPKKEEMLRGLFEMAVGRLDCYGFGVHPMIVGFCGKIYKLAELFATHPESSAWSTTEQRKRTRFAYSVVDVDTYVRHNRPDYVDAYLSPRGRNGRDGFHRQYKFFDYFEKDLHNDYRPAKVIREEAKAREKLVGEMFAKGPIFVADYNEQCVIYNAKLKPYEFYRVFDMGRAFQELSVWMSNQAIPIKPIPKLDDETMAEIKGFDKYSFRKAPGGKKRKNKKAPR